MNLDNGLKRLIEDIYFSGNLKKYIDELLFVKEGLKGDSNSEQWIKFFEKISLWKKDYLWKSDFISVYGALTWSLDVCFDEFKLTSSEICNWKETILKLILIDIFRDVKDIHIDKEADTISYIIKRELFDFVKEEVKKCYEISPEEFINDLKRYYDMSYERNQYNEKRYSNYKERLHRLDSDYNRYSRYIEFFKTNFAQCEIVRINHLGEYEEKYEGREFRTEISWYFIFNKDRIWLVTLSDFA